MHCVLRLADQCCGASERDWPVCTRQELGLDPIVANLDLDRVNPHLRQLAKATQGNSLCARGINQHKRCRARWLQPFFYA